MSKKGKLPGLSLFSVEGSRSLGCTSPAASTSRRHQDRHQHPSSCGAAATNTTAACEDPASPIPRGPHPSSCGAAAAACEDPASPIPRGRPACGNSLLPPLRLGRRTYFAEPSQGSATTQPQQQAPIVRQSSRDTSHVAHHVAHFCPLHAFIAVSESVPRGRSLRPCTIHMLNLAGHMAVLVFQETYVSDCECDVKIQH
jgi:hypothetical protein